MASHRSREKTNGHIVALGGGGFSMEPENPLLDNFILSLAPKQPAKICFIPTASADSPTYLAKFYRAFSGRAIATDLTFSDSASLPQRPARTSDIPGFIAEQDIIYVGGGNTANMLAIWRAHGIDRVLHEAWIQGKVLCGISAGMICWFQDGLTDSFGDLKPLGDGLGFIEGSACPHYDGEKGRPDAYRKAIRNGMRSGYAADDGAALHFNGAEMVEVVTSREGAAAYRLELSNGDITETRLQVRYLGGSSAAAGAGA
jgi:peptidase E